DQSHEGDRGLHKITVTTTKAGDHLTFDFTGTDPQAGVINCTYAGLRGGVMLALLPILAGDIPWSAGGLMRCFDLITEEGTLNNATFPAAVSRGPIGPAWLPAAWSPSACPACSTGPWSWARMSRPPAAAPGTPRSSPVSTNAASSPRRSSTSSWSRWRAGTAPARTLTGSTPAACSASRWAASPTSR